MHRLFAASVCVLILTSGCAYKPMKRIVDSEQSSFTAHTKHNDMAVYARMCSHEEIAFAFSRPDDFFHYYHLLHVRCINAGYIRYTLQPDGCSFFVPPSSILRPYTQHVAGGTGALIAFLNALVGFPIYLISMLKAAVETPPYLLEPELVVPRSFGTLSMMYAGVVLCPLILGWAYERSANSAYFAHVDTHVMTQNQEQSVGPYMTKDILVATPRSGFVNPCSLAFYNHKTKQQELVTIDVSMVW
jgi:hypothetical protein